MRYLSTAFAITLAAACAACAMRISPLRIHDDGVVETRPKGYFGTLGDRWRKIEISLPKQNVKWLHEWESTFFVEITNCEGKGLMPYELFVNGTSVALLSMEDAEFDQFYKTLKDPVKGYVYIEESRYENQQHLCMSFDGGSMTAAKVWSTEYGIK